MSDSPKHWLEKWRAGKLLEPPQTFTCSKVWGGNTWSISEYNVPGLNCHLLSIPYGNANSGGDLYYTSVCNSGIISRFLLLDLMGHGDLAGALSSKLIIPLDKFMDEPSNESVLGELNQLIREMHASPFFATAALGTYIKTENTWIYTYAGHPYMFIRRNERWSELTAHRGRTLPVGVVGDNDYYQSSIKLEENDWLFVYSDAVLEIAQTDPSFQYGEGLTGLLNSLHSDDVNQFFLAFTEHIVTLNGGTDFPDDLTYMLIRHDGTIM